MPLVTVIGGARQRATRTPSRRMAKSETQDFSVDLRDIGASHLICSTVFAPSHPCHIFIVRKRELDGKVSDGRPLLLKRRSTLLGPGAHEVEVSCSRNQCRLPYTSVAVRSTKPAPQVIIIDLNWATDSPRGLDHGGTRSTCQEV